MDWLYQNWVWIVVLIGGYVLMSRMGMGGCGMGHSHGHSHAGHGGGADARTNDKGLNPINVFDPVSHHMLPAATGIASVHKGRI